MRPFAINGPRSSSPLVRSGEFEGYLSLTKPQENSAHITRLSTLISVLPQGPVEEQSFLLENDLQLKESDYLSE